MAYMYKNTKYLIVSLDIDLLCKTRLTYIIFPVLIFYHFSTYHVGVGRGKVRDWHKEC